MKDYEEPPKVKQLDPREVKQARKSLEDSRAAFLSRIGCCGASSREGCTKKRCPVNP